jgi:hypothetical protein
MKTQRGIAILVVLFVLAFIPLFRPWIHGDGIGYYSWLRSIVIDGTLDVRNTIAHYSDGEWKFTIQTLNTGYTYNMYGVGCALFWFPFFLISHVFVHTALYLGYHVSPDGFSLPYIWSLCAGSALYGLGTIIITYYICRNTLGLKSRVSLLAVVTVWFSTTFLFYMYCNASMSHTIDSFAYAIFLLAWCKTNDKNTTGSAALRGASLGLCALVRQVNTVFVAFNLGEYLMLGIRGWQTKDRLFRVRTAIILILAFSITWWIIFFPQLIVWKIVFGQWIVGNPYELCEYFTYTFDLTRPHILTILFSSNRGLLSWTPITIPAIIGLWYMRRNHPVLSYLLASNLFIEIYLVASSWVVDGMVNGLLVGPGNRVFTNMMPTFALGLAALLNDLEERVSFKYLVAGCIVFIVWNGTLLARYAANSIPRWGPVSYEELLLGQFRFIFQWALKICHVLLP